MRWHPERECVGAFDWRVAHTLVAHTLVAHTLVACLPGVLSAKWTDTETQRQRQRERRAEGRQAHVGE